LRIDPEICIACEACLAVCPMTAINMQDEVAVIDQDECVDCGVCRRSGVCPVDCIIYEPALWPRAVRVAFSDPFAEHKVTGLPGRGTEEVKTNEVTGRLQPGWLALGIEFGRPVTGARFRDVDKVAQALARLGVKFEPKNPVTVLMTDQATGKIQEDVLDEKVLSAIIECVFPEEQGPAVLKTLQEVTKEIDTVCSVEMANLVEPDEQVPMEKMLAELGIFYRPNGKTNIGLGRPKFKFEGGGR
jgi:NAD-dependent dihydropyrimidine dehydrogenase PreA subunit